MKALIAVLLVAVGIAVAYSLYTKDAPVHPPADKSQNLPIWRQPLPAGTVPVPAEQVKLNVRIERRDQGDRHEVVFYINEEHGYLVDGIRLHFWYRFKDEDTGEWIDDINRVEHFVRDRLEFNETLVTSTTLRKPDYPGLGVDVMTTTTDDWGVAVVNFERAARKVE